MKYRIIIISGLVFVMVFLLSCVAQKAPSTLPVEPASVKEREQVSTKELWELEWEKTLKAANKESTVVVYVSVVAPALKESVPVFKQKFGINPELVTGRGAELRGRLLQERAHGIFVADVLISGLNTIFGDIKPARAAEPLEPVLILPEVVDPKGWYDGKIPWAEKERRVFNFMYFPYEQIGINTEMVKPDEIKSYYDLLDPKWKGKIIINDPTITGRGFNSFSTMVYNKVLDLDFFRQLVNQQPQLTRDQRLQVEWLARKKYPVALWPHNVQMAEFQEIAAPLAWVSSKEGTYIGSSGGALVFMNRAPHPNAAKIFINWLLSKEGQLLMQNFAQQQSSRVDISVEGLDPIGVRKPGRTYFTSANEIEKWVLEEQDKYLEFAKQVFGPLMGK